MRICAESESIKKQTKRRTIDTALNGAGGESHVTGQKNLTTDRSAPKNNRVSVREECTKHRNSRGGKGEGLTRAKRSTYFPLYSMLSLTHHVKPDL